MRYRITTPEVNWGGRKARMMRQDLMRFLRANGANGATWEELDGTDDAAASAARYLHLQCKPCGIAWYWEAFQPCPQCGQKRTVSKATISRVALPETATLGQPFPREPDKAARPPITMAEAG